MLIAGINITAITALPSHHKFGNSLILAHLEFNSDVMWYFSVKHKLQDLPPGLNSYAWSSMLHVRIGSEPFLLHSHTNFESSVELALLS